MTRDLCLWYGKFQALKNVSVEIKHGLITSLIGPSGCGKTTLLRCFNRINERYGNVTTTGEIRLLGQEHLRPRRFADRTAQIGRHGVSAAQSAADLRLRKRRLRPAHPRRPAALKQSDLDDAVEKPLTEVGLWKDLKDRLERKATSLQLEQQQKLCIARLLPLKPEIILMDEPCSALDVEAPARSRN